MPLFHDGLCKQQAVEWITVMRGQLIECSSVSAPRWQLFETIRRGGIDELREVDIDSAEGLLDGDLPERDGADRDIIGGQLDRGADRTCQPAVVAHPP